MESILEKLNSLNDIIDILDETNNENINYELSDYIDQLNILTDKMIETTSKANISKNKYDDLLKNNKKQKFLHKHLFPCYYILNESIKNMENEKIEEIDKILDNSYKNDDNNNNI